MSFVTYARGKGIWIIQPRISFSSVTIPTVWSINLGMRARQKTKHRDFLSKPWWCFKNTHVFIVKHLTRVGWANKPETVFARLRLKEMDQGRQSTLFDQQWRIVKQEGKSLCTFSQTPPMVFHHDFLRSHCKWIRALTTDTGIIVPHLSVAIFDSLSGYRGATVCGHRWTAEEDQEADDSGCEEHDFGDHD